MRILLVVKQKKNVDTFQATIARLLALGHEVLLAIQERDPDRDKRLDEQFPAKGFTVLTCPASRSDAWRTSAPLLRSISDWAQYLRPPYEHAWKLRQRAADKLRKELGGAALADADLVTALQPAASRLHELLKRIESAIPSDPLHAEFIARHQPDLVLVTPGVHFGSAQADVIKSARAAGVPVWMLLFSWDNLSTKGALHVAPDRMLVWNERQRREAAELHGYPQDRVVTVGAPRFDEFFALRPAVSREEFFRPLGLDASKPALLYVCSSRFVAERELPFITRWLAALRGSPHAVLRDCNVIVRPHPDIALVDGSGDAPTVTWPSLHQAMGWVQRPFEDPAALVLRTTYRTQQAFFECLYHSAAVVGLNTSAELEAGIVGRPVYTVLAEDEAVQGQASTLHFNYLLREHGGFVACSRTLDEHAGELATALTAPPDSAAIRAFIASFLRPNGDRPVSELLAETIVQAAVGGRQAAVGESESDSRQPIADRGSADIEPEFTKELRIGYPGSNARVLATPETKRSRQRGVLLIDEATSAWLTEQMQPGDVLYDIGAGVGAVSIVGAISRGGLVVAFEPGFTTFGRLCDNVLRNGCYRSVIPLPMALGDRAGLLELEYPHTAGDDIHVLRPREWRMRRDAVEAQYAQPVTVDRLDEVVVRHQLPEAHVIRINVAGAGAVLAGAGKTLRAPQLRSVLVAARDADDAAAAQKALEAAGFDDAARTSTRDRWTILTMHRAASRRMRSGGWRDALRGLSR